MAWVSGSFRRKSVVQVSSRDVPLIALPNVTRLKIEGPINTCLAAATQPTTCDAIRCSHAWIITRLCRDSWCQGGDWKIEVHLQLREKFSANLTRWPLVPSQEINSYELSSSQWHTHKCSVSLKDIHDISGKQRHVCFVWLPLIGYVFIIVSCVITDWNAAVLYWPT